MSGWGVLYIVALDKDDGGGGGVGGVDDYDFYSGVGSLRTFGPPSY